MTYQNQQLTKQSPAQFNAFLQKHKSQLANALPKHLSADRMARIALTEFSKNPKIQECDPKSIFGSIVIAGQLGLEPGINGQGYLIPYNGVCTFVPGWKGLVDLVSRSGRATVWTGAVYEGDEFDYMLGSNPYCNHKPMGEFDVKKLTHVYAIGKVKGAEMPVIEVWTVDRVDAHFKKNVIKGLQKYHYAIKDNRKHFEMYARKVVLLQVLKYMPQSIEISNALEVSNAVEQGQKVVIDGDFVTVESEPMNEPQQAQEAPAIDPQQVQQAQQALQQSKNEPVPQATQSAPVEQPQQAPQQEQLPVEQPQSTGFGSVE